MRHLYTLVFVVGLIVLSPVFVFRAVRRRKYVGSIRERLGSVSVPPATGRTLWVHAVSVGETVAVEPFVMAAIAELEGWRVVLSTTTATGQRVARERFPDLPVFYFPLDLPFAAGRALDRVRPDAVCVVETEIWPNFLRQCRRRRIPVMLVNGRLSDRSARGYGHLGRLLAPILDDFSGFFMQSTSDAARIVELGAPEARVRVTGNLKYDVDREALELRLRTRRAEVAAAFGLPDPRPLVVAGSTGAGEEAMLADALRSLRCDATLSETRLLVAPRHPERFDDAERAFVDAGFRVARRTRPDTDRSADVLLLDSIGELAAVYEFADVVFVGGSLVPSGGHNILEPALFGRPIVVGPHTENFRQIVEAFRDEQAVVQLESGATSESLAREIANLLRDRSAASAMGERARLLVDANRGATRRTLDLVGDCIGVSAKTAVREPA